MISSILNVTGVEIFFTSFVQNKSTEFRIHENPVTDTSNIRNKIELLLLQLNTLISSCFKKITRINVFSVMNLCIYQKQSNLTWVNKLAITYLVLKNDEHTHPLITYNIVLGTVSRMRGNVIINLINKWSYNKTAINYPTHWTLSYIKNCAVRWGK